jgi:hypothetical protein
MENKKKIGKNIRKKNKVIIMQLLIGILNLKVRKEKENKMGKEKVN